MALRKETIKAPFKVRKVILNKLSKSYILIAGQEGSGTCDNGILVHISKKKKKKIPNLSRCNLFSTVIFTGSLLIILYRQTTPPVSTRLADLHLEQEPNEGRQARCDEASPGNQSQEDKAGVTHPQIHCRRQLKPLPHPSWC